MPNILLWKIEMTEKELTELRQTHRTPSLISYEGPDKTLVWGYTMDRSSFHVYSIDNLIHRYIYDFNEDETKFDVKKEWEPSELIPCKRTYPSASDFEFCKKIIEMGESISFTTLDNREPAQFYGKIK